MVSERELPRSNDPYALLGINRAASRTEIRRAYVALIKQFRPETHPSEFQRLHAAYQALLGRSQTSAPDSEPFEDVTAAGPVAEHDIGSDLVEEALRGAWMHLASGGDLEQLRRQLGKLMNEHPAHGLPWVHAYILDTMVGDPGNSLRRCLDAYEGGARLVRWLAALTDERFFISQLDHRALKWNHLRDDPDREGAVRLLQGVVRARLLAGQTEYAAAIVLAEQFIGDSFEHPALEMTAQAVAAVAAWDHPELAEKIFALMPSSGKLSDDGWTNEDHGNMAAGVGPAWRAWCGRYPELRSLHAFVPLAAVTEDEAVGPLCAALHEDFQKRTPEYLHALCDLASASPDLIRFIAQSAHMQPVASFDTSTEPPGLRDDLDGINRAVARSWIYWTYLASIAVLALCPFWFSDALGVWSLPLCVAVFFAIKPISKPIRAIVYARSARLKLLGLLASSPVTLDTVLRVIGERRNALDKLQFLDGPFLDDPVPDAVVALRRLGTVRADRDP